MKICTYFKYSTVQSQLNYRDCEKSLHSIMILPVTKKTIIVYSSFSYHFFRIGSHIVLFRGFAYTLIDPCTKNQRKVDSFLK